jgi:tetratricopeptide (TPR) repeat protein/transcriptional regulator with XRE-family HTH domain
MGSNYPPAELPRPRMRLVEARLLRGWSQQEVAERLGTTHVNVSRWERGVTKPNPYFRRKLCRLFGLTEEELDLLPAMPETQEVGAGSTTLSQADETPPVATSLAAPSHEASPASSTLAPPSTAVIDPMIPLPAPVQLVGRDAELARIRQRLFAGDAVALTALNGLPGVGKTSLAVALAHDPEVRAHFSDGILWAALGPRPNLMGLLSRWGRLLGLSTAEMSGLANTEAWARSLRMAIGRRRMLLVIDDAWRLDEALALKVGGAQCAHLLTTRFAQLASDFAVDGAAVVQELSEEDSLTLLRLLAPTVVEQEPASVRALIQAVGGLPLALTLIGNYLRKESYSGQARRIRAALQRLSDAGVRLGLTEQRGPVETHSSLPGEHALSLQSVIAVSDEQLSETARAALYALAVFPPKPASFSEEAALAVAACTVEDLDALVDAGLLESQGDDRYALHQVIADYARARLRERNGMAGPAGRLIDYAIACVEAHRTDYELLERESSVVLAALEAAHVLGRGAELVRGVVAFVPFLLVRSSYEMAESLLQRAQAAAQALDDRRGLAAVLFYLGRIALYQGDYAGAEARHQEGLALARQIDDPERISALLIDLGTVAARRGEYARSEAYLEEGLALARRLGHKEQLCQLLQTLGGLVARLGNYEQADAYLQEGLALARELGDRERICTLLTGLGISAGERGNLLKAKACFQEALSQAQQIGHRLWTSALLNNLGDLSLAQEDYAEAERFFREGLALARQIEQQEYISGMLLNLGLVAWRQGRLVEAQASFQEGLALARVVGFPFLICSGLYEYGNFCLAQQRLQEAREAFMEMLSMAPEGSRDTVALARYGLARVAAAEGDLPEARELASQSAGVLEALGHRSAGEVRSWLSSLAG